MKSLQTLVAISLLIATASVAHASACSTLSASTLAPEAYTQEATLDSGSQSADHPGAEQLGDPSASRHDSGTSAHLPGNSSKAVDSSPTEAVRTPSWQSLLPGSIQ